MQDREIFQIVSDVQHEAILGFIRRYPQFRERGLTQYAESVRERFLNPHIAMMSRGLVRDPLRKLSANDRLVGPLKLAREVTPNPGAYERHRHGFRV